MSEAPEQTSMRLGVFDRRVDETEMSTGEKIALGLAGFWSIGAILYLIAAASPDTGPDPLRSLMAILVIFLPLGLVWIGVALRASVRATAQQGAALQIAMDQFRKAQAESTQRSVMGIRPASPATPAPTDLPMAAPDGRRRDRAFATPEPIVQTDAVDDSAPELFDAPALPDLPIDTLIRALHFPETADDALGFEALKAALRHHPSARCVQSAEDMLTLLSQDGIYMDDLIPDRAKPDIWRRFAKGERGRAVNELGGVRDRAALALSARRMREEPIFRDSAHHFLRSFDQTLARIEPEATDAELARLSDTRSARAFMLMGRVSGLFG